MIRSWLQRRRERAELKRYERGFGWAMCRYYLDAWPRGYVEDTVLNSTLHYDSFDRGATDAMRFVPYTDSDAVSGPPPIAPGDLNR